MPQGRQRLAVRATVWRQCLLQGDWTMRAAAAMAGIYGNDAVEAMYPLLAHRQRREDARLQQEPSTR